MSDIYYMRKNEVSNWYINKHQGQNIQKEEIERKWRLYLWEKEQMELAESISVRDASISSSGGGASIGPEPTSQIELTTQNGQILQTQDGQNIILT
jgi:hypothetical protein